MVFGGGKTLSATSMCQLGFPICRLMERIIFHPAIVGVNVLAVITRVNLSIFGNPDTEGAVPWIQRESFLADHYKVVGWRVVCG